MDLRLSVISIVAMIALPVFSQEDSIKTVHRIAADAVPATIFHTNEFLRGGNEEIRTMNHDMTFTLKYAFMNRDEVRPGAIHQGVYQGVGYGIGLNLVSAIMMLFMNCLEVLVAFIQAYVFTLLSAVFIGLAQKEEEAEA